MTLIIGMYYTKGEGAIIVSDSIVVRETDFTTEQKLFKITKDSAIASAGLSGTYLELLENVKERLNTDAIDIKGLKRMMEDEALKIFYRYRRSDTPTFQEDEETLFDGIVGGFYNGTPRLYYLSEPGYMEPMNRPYSTGDGSRHATQIIETLCKPDISKERAIEIAVHSIIQTSKLDTVVDTNPQIAIFEKEKCMILNYSKDGEFLFNKPEILEIKEKINGIAEKQSKIFDLMLDGSEEIKNQLIDLLNKYDKTKD